MRVFRAIRSPLHGIVLVLTASLILWGAGCQRDAVGPDPGDPILSLSIISDPAPSISLSSNGGRSFAVAPDAYAAYISVPRDSLPGVASVTIRNPRTGETTVATVVDGGFDPVAVKAVNGDLLKLTLHSAVGAADKYVSLVVPKVRKPTIVRTDPPKGKRDVQLNSAVLMVFSEPIDTRTVTSTSVQLRLDGTPVAGRLEFQDTDHLVLAFVPDRPLSGLSTYELIVTDAIRDLDGEGLEPALESDFTTEVHPTGSIRVTTSTSGEDIDPDGYTVATDTAVVGSAAIGTNSTVVLTAVPAGARIVSLTGVASNCTVTANSIPVTIERDATVTVAFTVTCARGTGSIRVNTVTSGVDVDPDGYSIVVDGGANPVAIAASGSVLLSNVMTGSHSISLVGVAANCTVPAPHPATVIVELNAVAAINLSISCIRGTGSIRVTTVTSGDDIDPDGFWVAVDAGANPAAIAAGGSVVISNVPTGNHSISLIGVAANCTVAAPHPVTVMVEMNAVASTDFAISCTRVTGSIRVTTVTSGGDLDSDGYTIFVDEGPGIVSIASNGSVVLPDLATGTHSIRLENVSVNCTFTTPNPLTVTVMPNATVNADFAVSCVQITGSIQVTSATLGTDLDPDGYAVALEGDGEYSAPTLPPNGQITIDRIVAGQRYVWLFGVAGNCNVTGTHPRPVLLQPGDTAVVNFEIVCVPLAAIRLTATTTGVDLPETGYTARLRHLGAIGEIDVPLNGSLTISPVSLGDNVIELGGISGNCDVIGENPRVISASSGTTVDVDFVINCSPATLLAFSGAGSGEDIYSIRSNGTGLRRLTSSSATDADPEWSPDGTRIVFRSHRDGNAEIYVMNADGSAQTRLTSNPTVDQEPTWSPDGSRIAFVSRRDGNAEIYVMNADGSNQVRLTMNAVTDLSPSWSPDGSRIAFRSDRIATQPGNGEIYVMNPDGSNVVRLTFDIADDATPAWSPDGSKIAFARFIACGGQYEGVFCQYDIFTMNADGSATARVSSTSAFDHWGNQLSGDERSPAWSPDGRKLAITAIFCFTEGGGSPCEMSGAITIVQPGVPGHRDLAGGNYPAWRR